MNTYPGSRRDWVNTRYLESMTVLRQLGYSPDVARAMTAEAFIGTFHSPNAVAATNWGADEENYNWMGSDEPFPGVERDADGRPIFTSLHVATQRLWTMWQMRGYPSGMHGRYALSRDYWLSFGALIGAAEVRAIQASFAAIDRANHPGAPPPPPAPPRPPAPPPPPPPPGPPPLPVGREDEGGDDAPPEEPPAPRRSSKAGAALAALVVGLALLGAKKGSGR